MEGQKIKVGITQGDINGIGYEVIIKTLMDSRIVELCTPIIYGSPKVAAYHRKALNISNFSLNSVMTAAEAHPKRSNIVNCLDDNIKVELGRSTSIAGKASLNALQQATQDLEDGVIDVLVTAPINKNNIQSEEFDFPGHTEYLQQRFNSESSLMIMVSDLMRVAVVTGHVPLSEVSQLITKEHVIEKLKTLNDSLIKDFGIRKPKIAVLGLNPHAGDNGVLGNEEEEIIIPAINEAMQQHNIMATGPFPADGFFGSNHYSKFDAILAMYHDQGLIPFKSLVFDKGVNFTAGLPIVRTSPAHGTAYDMAGLNHASEESFRQALYLALDIFRKRKEYVELTVNPLEPQPEGTGSPTKPVPPRGLPFLIEKNAEDLEEMISTDKEKPATDKEALPRRREPRGDRNGSFQDRTRNPNWQERRKPRSVEDQSESTEEETDNKTPESPVDTPSQEDISVTNQVAQPEKESQTPAAEESERFSEEKEMEDEVKEDDQKVDSEDQPLENPQRKEEPQQERQDPNRARGRGRFKGRPYNRNTNYQRRLRKPGGSSNKPSENS